MPVHRSVVDIWMSDNPGKTLGDTRKEFREILGTDVPIPAPVASHPKDNVPEDHTHAHRRWEEAPYIEDQRTYAEDHGISKGTLKALQK